MRLNQIARKLNIGTGTIVTYLEKKGIIIEKSPNTKITPTQLELLEKNFLETKKPSNVSPVSTTSLTTPAPPKKAPKSEVESVKPNITSFSAVPTPKITSLRQVNMTKIKNKQPVIPATPTQSKKEEIIERKVIVPPKNIKRITTDAPILKGVTTLRKIVVPKQERPKEPIKPKKVFRKRIFSTPKPAKSPVKEREIKSIAPTYRRFRRPSTGRRKTFKKKVKVEEVSNVIHLTEFITANELALLMDISIQKLLEICATMGIEASINQRLDKEKIVVIADELKKEISFITIEEELTTIEEERPEDLQPRAPIVTVMGHVDHGKTSLLDYIRKEKVADGEAGGITQHIGAYEVEVKDKGRVVFLDTPGHEAFTAMRARGAQITDIVIIVIAADDGIMPQTKEAISHAQLADLQIVFALNKMDKPQADAERVKQQLSQMNVLVEDWGGEYQCQEISAQTGAGIDELLEKVLLEAEMLELKAAPNRNAQGVVIESSIERGRGYLVTAMVEEGTLKKGDVLFAGPYFGKVKALSNTQGKPVKQVLPATPIQILGLNGSPKSGQVFKVVKSEKEARMIATKYKNVLQEQRLRAQHGNPLEKLRQKLSKKEDVQELNVIIKGDVDGSIEALADTILSLNSKKTTIQVIYKAVGPISESDVLLASASSALIIGFQTKISPPARKAINKENIEVKLCDIIYEATDYIEELMKKQAGISEEEEIIGKAEVVKIFTISKIGTIAGCIVKEGMVKRNAQVRIVRDDKIVYKGAIKQLKREKEVIKEAKIGSECGISLMNFNDIQVGDFIESIEIKKAE